MPLDVVFSVNGTTFDLDFNFTGVLNPDGSEADLCPLDVENDWDGDFMVLTVARTIAKMTRTATSFAATRTYVRTIPKTTSMATLCAGMSTQLAPLAVSDELAPWL